MKSKALKTAAAIVVLSVFGIGGYVLKVWANPATGVTRHLIGRGTYDRFMVNTDTNQVPFQYIAKAQPAIDMEVDTHSYDPLGSTGWHKHPGPVYITVTSGELTFYELDDPTCSPHVYKAGQGFVDFGNGHIGINQDPTNPASDVTVAVTYVGGPFRTELPANANPNCSFDVWGTKSFRRGTVWGPHIFATRETDLCFERKWEPAPYRTLPCRAEIPLFEFE